MRDLELQNVRDSEWFKQESLVLLRDRLAEQTYPGYPSRSERIYGSLDELDIPQEWPTHPWINEMLADPDIGVVTDKRFYWNYGPNKTADPIIIRHDIGNEPHILLIERGDGTGWALPGGFVNQGEDEKGAARREANEEAGVNVDLLQHSSKVVYVGPLADLRITANAWPETTAVLFDLVLETKKDQKKLAEMMAPKRWQRVLRSLGNVAFKNQVARLPWKGDDDALRAAWVPESAVSKRLFGSHKLLIELAMRDLRHGSFAS